MAINNLDGHPALLRNDGGAQAGYCLTLALGGVRNNRSAIGARVTLETESRRQMREK